MSGVGPTGAARTAQDVPRNDLALRIATDVLADRSRADGLAEWMASPNTDLHEAVERFAKSRVDAALSHLAGQAGPEVRGLVEDLTAKAYADGWAVGSSPNPHWTRPESEVVAKARTALLAAYAAKDAELAHAVAALRADEDGPSDDLVGLSLIWIGGEEMHDRFLAWYKPEGWPLGRHRAASAFLRTELAALRQQLDEAAPLLELLLEWEERLRDPTKTGAVITDFYRVWLEQEKAETRKAKAEAASERQRAERLARVLRDARENEQLQNADPVLCCEIDNVLEEPTR